MQVHDNGSARCAPRRNNPERRHAVIEIVDNRVYTEQKLELPLDPGDDLTLRAADRTRPILRLLDSSGMQLLTIGLQRPSLDDVFLRKTGRSLRETAA